MKMILLTSMAAVLLLAGAGCTSVRSSGNDAAKVVARILARTAPAVLAFKDRAAAQQLVSSLDTSEYFDFGVILDAQKQVFASYFRPEQIPQKEKFLARVTESAPTEESEKLVLDHGISIAMVRMGSKERTVGYVAIGRKGR
jgi:hypothetical protein